MSTPGERQAIKMGKGSPVDFGNPELSRTAQEIWEEGPMRERDQALIDSLTARLGEAEALLRERTLAAHTYGQWLAALANRVPSHKGSESSLCPSKGCGRTRAWLEGAGK